MGKGLLSTATQTSSSVSDKRVVVLRTVNKNRRLVLPLLCHVTGARGGIHHLGI